MVYKMQRARSRMSMSPRSNQGVTLVELMVTITVLAILLAIGVPAMARLINDARVSTSTNEFVNALNLARIEAIKRGRLVTVCSGENCSGATGDWRSGWIVYVESSTSANVGSYEAGEEVILRKAALPQNMNTENATLGRITFGATGLPVSANAGFGVNLSYGASAEHARQICMSSAGRVRVIKDGLNC